MQGQRNIVPSRSHLLQHSFIVLLFLFSSLGGWNFTDLVSDMRLDVDTLLSQEVHPRLAALLTGMCLQPLAQIPKVMSAYRMTSRDVTGPSDYIQEVLHPLQSLLEEVCVDFSLCAFFTPLEEIAKGVSLSQFFPPNL